MYYTGHLTAACICIQKCLGRALLWCACRKHVGEIMLSRVWEALKVEVSSSKDISVFVRFRDSFSNLSSQDFSNFTSVCPTTDAFLLEQRQTVIELLTSLKSQAKEGSLENLVRADYRELLDLTLVYLTGEFSDRFCLNKPGATSKARWMGKWLYGLKMALLEEQIKQLSPNKMYTRHRPPKIKQFLDFIVHIYVPWWFTCSISAAAPCNDLLLIKNLNRYMDVNNNVAQAALKAFKRHLWYLVLDLVPLALFDNNLQSEQKQLLANAILQQPKDVVYESRSLLEKIRGNFLLH